MKLLSAMLLLFSLSCFSSTVVTSLTSFNYDDDSMCFRNGASELNGVVPILGALGDKQGVCQGIAGVSSAFYANAEFDQSLPVPSNTKEAEKLIKRVIKLHKGNCSQRITIPGFANMNEFCKAHKQLFFKHVIWYNADISAKEIFLNLPLFLAQKKDEVTKPKRLEKIHKTLNSLRDSLKVNRPPLMLYYRHVVMVTEMEDIYENGKLSRVNLRVYDSNMGMSDRWTFEYDENSLPKSGSQMIWDITPDRFFVSCR